MLFGRRSRSPRGGWRSGSIRGGVGRRGIRREIGNLQLEQRGIGHSTKIRRASRLILLQRSCLVTLRILRIAAHLVITRRERARLHAIQSRERLVRLLLRNLHASKAQAPDQRELRVL